MFTVACLFIIAALTAAAIFHPCFDDTLIQRFCLGGLSLGALGTGYWVLVRGLDLPDPVEWMTWFGMVYAMETGRKLLFRRGPSCKS